jgi:uncharacterized protein YecE (DUF72 family)
MNPQNLLFQGTGLEKEDGHLQALPPSEEWLAAANRWPSRVKIGTSSWSVPGWNNILYKNAKNKRQLAHEGLAIYNKNPLLNMVGIDRTYYAPIPASTFAKYSEQVRAGFKFMVKAHHHVTQARFPNNPRSGKRAGALNDRFLDSAYATDAVIEPAITGLGDKLGPLVFQFPPQSVRIMGGAQPFADKLYEFLSKLPSGPLYAVELRNDELLTQDYGNALYAAGVSHCINVHPHFHDPLEQINRQLHKIGPSLVIRWMLRRNLDYKNAVKKYAPFTNLAEPDLRTRQLLVDLCRKEKQRDIYMTINNKAEGCSPLSLLEFAKLTLELEQK